MNGCRYHLEMEDAAEVRVRPICHEPVLDEAWEGVMGVGLFRRGGGARVLPTAVMQQPFQSDGESERYNETSKLETSDFNFDSLRCIFLQQRHPDDNWFY